MNNFLKIVSTASSSHNSGQNEQVTRCASSADEIFGGASQLLDDSAWIDTAGSSPLTDSALFHVVVVALLLGYLLLWFRNPDLIRYVFDRILSPDTSHSERLYDERSAATNNHFITSIIFTGILFATVFALKFVDVLLPSSIIATLPHATTTLSVPGMALGLCSVVALQIVILVTTGKITISQPLTSALIYVKELYFAFALFLIAPAMILYALCPDGEGRVWLTVIALQLLCVVILFLRETFLLFISKKVSISHWILYLCGVEMFPVTLLCLIASKTLM